MTIEAKIIADSISDQGKRLTTMQLRYPRFIHAEFMTHRVFSRNASSSRAIPVEKMIADLRRELAMPVYWGSNKPGMQAGAELTGKDLEIVKSLWHTGSEHAIGVAEQMIKAGLHKQIANRVLEPWSHINVVVTATEWANYFMLRRHKDAQPEIRVLANMMYESLMASDPAVLTRGEWHLPYVMEKVGAVNSGEQGMIPLPTAIKVSIARCARVSYLTHKGTPSSLKEDLDLYERLLGAKPIHASPSEHQATPDRWLYVHDRHEWLHPEDWGNFVGWRQYRKMMENKSA